MKLTEREKKIYITINGYEVGHHDTVEGIYNDAYELGIIYYNLGIS